MVSRSVLEQTGQLDQWGDYIPQPQSQDPSTANTAQQTCWLNQFSALKISGPDAERFLQGQLTCNMTDITTRSVFHGACCTAKGRIVANFNISFDGENYWLILPTLSAEVLEKHLQKYKVFFKTTLENCTQSHLILGQWNESEAGAAIHTKEYHQLSLSNNRSFLIVSDLSELEYTLSPSINWRLADINEGIYYVEGAQIEQWIPQHISWHSVNGISFNKGCYTGQEIIARLQYLGKAKKALQHYQGAINSKTIDGISESTNLTSEGLISAQQLFDEGGKNKAEVLIIRNHNSLESATASTEFGSESIIDILVVGQGENPPKILYLTETNEFPLTLQNLPYTDLKEV